jgi:hypothetical protein
MKNSKLINTLSKLNPDAEVGFEYMKVTTVTVDDNNEYIDLGGDGAVVDKNTIKSTGIFVLNMVCFNIDTNNEYKEVSGVFSKRDRATKMGEFLISASKVEPFLNDKNEKIIYKNYEVENFILL